MRGKVLREQHFGRETKRKCAWVVIPVKGVKNILKCGGFIDMGVRKI
jgi:hypothetical protein